MPPRRGDSRMRRFLVDAAMRRAGDIYIEFLADIATTLRCRLAEVAGCLPLGRLIRHWLAWLRLVFHISKLFFARSECRRSPASAPSRLRRELIELLVSQYLYRASSVGHTFRFHGRQALIIGMRIEMCHLDLTPNTIGSVMIKMRAQGMSAVFNCR